MDILHIGPTLLSTIAWGCSLNIIVSPSIAEKEGLVVPDFIYSNNFALSGKIGIFISTLLAVLSVGGLWGILIVPAGGMLFGGISTAIFREGMIAWSVPIAMLSSLCCAIWLYLIF